MRLEVIEEGIEGGAGLKLVERVFVSFVVKDLDNLVNCQNRVYI